MTHTVGVLNRVHSLEEFFSAAVARWGIFFLLPLPFLKSVAKCHVSQKSEPGSPRESEVSVVTCDTYRECFEQGALSRRIFLRGTTAVEKNSSVVFTLFEISS